MKLKGALALASLWIGGAAHAAELKDCVDISDDVVRLFCYDRAVGRKADGARSDAAPVAELPKSVPAEQAAPAPTVSAVTQESAPEREPAPAAEPAPTPNPKRIEAHIVGRFEGWSTGTKFVLDNGQTWEAVGASTHYSKSESPKVVIERDFIGQHLMSVDGVKSRALVRRIDN